MTEIAYKKTNLGLFVKYFHEGSIDKMNFIGITKWFTFLCLVL